jgi:hypothetical protein
MLRTNGKKSANLINKDCKNLVMNKNNKGTKNPSVH